MRLNNLEQLDQLPRRDRAAAAKLIVAELLRHSTQRDLATEIGVTQYWVYRHAHQETGVPSDAVWRKLIESYLALGYVGTREGYGKNNNQIRINREDGGGLDTASRKKIVAHADRGGDWLSLRQRLQLEQRGE